MEKRDEDHSSQLANGPIDGSTCLDDSKFCRLHRDRRHHIKTTFTRSNFPGDLIIEEQE